MRKSLPLFWVLVLSSVSVFFHATAEAQEGPPVVRQMGPQTIAAGGPTFTLRLQGRNFAQGAEVLFDGVPLASRTSENGRILLADVDAALVASPGTHEVQARNPDDMTSATNTLTVVAEDADLNIRLVGNAGQEDTGLVLQTEITGEGFDEGSKVFVWGFDVAETELLSDTRLRFSIPSDLTTEPARIPIFVRNRGQRFSNYELFFIVPRPARITELQPDSIEVGDEDFELRVFANSLKDDSTILVNGIRLETTRARDGRLDAVVPGFLRATPQQLIVRVEHEGIQSSNEILSVTPSDEPFIYAVAPNIVRQGGNKEKVSIAGANLGNQSVVLVDGEEVKVKSTTRRSITFVLRDEILNAPGLHVVQVRDRNGALSNEIEFVVVPDLVVSTLSGRQREGFNGESECVAAEDAMFRRPRRMVQGADGLIYITDQQNHAIRTLNLDTGEVCTVSGTGSPGYNDSENPRDFEPAFSFPNGVTVGDDGTIYVSENGNNVIRRITPNGEGVVVDTLAGFNVPVTGAERQDNLNSTKAGRNGFRDGVALEAAFRLPDDMLMAPDGSIYVADPNNHAIRRIVFGPDGTVVETVAGNGVPGFADGVAQNARFNTPVGLSISPDGRFLFVADLNNSRIRRIDLVERLVDTYAGSGEFGTADGPAGMATFQQPIGLALDFDGTLYVSEFSGNRIRRIDTEGNVSTVAGSLRIKFRDGPGRTATFKLPRGILIDQARGLLLVADYENFRIRSIQLR